MNKPIRIDFFKIEDGKTSEHIMKYYGDLKSAVYAAREGRRDGYKTYLLYHVIDGLYDIAAELE